MNLFSNEAKWIKGCKANERAAQEGLYKLYYREMWQVCNRYLKSPELAEEVLNSAFLKVFQHISGFDPAKGKLKTWIKVIMIRTCIDFLRKQMHFRSGIPVVYDDDDFFVSPAVLEKLYAEDLMKAVRSLPAATQTVFNLSVMDGYSHKEIAAQLQITESTSRWHLTEAKKQLRARLEPGVTQEGMII